MQDDGRRATFGRAGQLQPASRTASPLGRVTTLAAENPRVTADPMAATVPQAEDADSVIMEADEEAEEGELRPGERAASLSEEEEGRFAGEPEGPQGELPHAGLS